MKLGEPGFNWGERNPAYKGKEAGYGAIHRWVRRRKPMPEFCERCGTEPPRDLANKTGKYLRDLADWEYLCRRCHMDSDGRNQKLVESGKSRKASNKICRNCGAEFHPKRKTSEFCNRQCYCSAGGKYLKTKENRAMKFFLISDTHL